MAKAPKDRGAEAPDLVQMKVSDFHAAMRYLRSSKADDKFLSSLKGDSRFIALSPQLVTTLKRHVDAAPAPEKPDLDRVTPFKVSGG